MFIHHSSIAGRETTDWHRFGMLWAMLLVAVSASSGTCLAQVKNIEEFSLSPKPKVGKPVFTTTLTPATANPGDEVTLAIAVELPKGFYIYSTDGEFDGRTQIDLKLEGLDPVDAGFTPDHAPKTEFEPVFNQEIGKHFDKVTWTRKFRIRSDATAASIHGELTGQYCGGPDAVQKSCIPILPAYRFNAAVKVANVAPVFSQQVRPMLIGGKKPAKILLDFALSPTDAKPGDKVTLSVKGALDDGWHTFSVTQSGDGGSPTSFELSELVGLKPLGDGFAADVPFEIEEQGERKLEVHYHTVTWTREFEVTSEKYGVAGEISYQTCRNGQCIPLKRVEFKLGQLDAAALPPANPQADVATPPAPPVAGPKHPERGNDALLPFLITCFIGGFLALLTPCSFPMVPITVSFFLHQSEAQHKRPWLLALVYCGTIIAAFTILGVGIAAIFGAAQLNQLANISWLNYAIGAVFVVFALNMLGLFELHMPAWLLTLTSSKESASSYVGAVFMALTFTLTSFTCTFAIAGALLVLASKGEFYRPVVGMLAFGTAFALPFFVLAMLPGLLKKLPKSGGWMNSVKVVMGLLELGAAVKFFSIADPGQILFNHMTVMLIWFVLALVTAIYLFGWFKLPHDTVSETISPFRMLLGISFSILAGLLLVGVAAPERGNIAVRQILAFAPARFEVADGDLGPSLKHHDLEFALYLDKALPVAQKQNRPLLLDFTGVNCANCRDMELKMAQPAWKERIAKFVGVQLYVDVPQIPTIHDRTEGEKLRAANEALELEMLKEVTMPSYVVVAPDGKTILAQYIGAETQPGSFVKFLDEGWTKWQELAGKGRGKLTEREVGMLKK